MKKIIISAALMSISICSHSKEHPNPTLDINQSTAESAHLTTRIQWAKYPQIQYEDRDLNGRDRFAIVRIKADENGKVTQASVQESTGIKKLDQILIQAVLKAQTQPIIKNGNRLSTVGYQTFSFKLSPEVSEACAFNFNSKQWSAQQTETKNAYRYLSQPQLNIDSELLAKHDRKVKFKFKADKHGVIEKAKITQGSGKYEIDQQVLQALNGVKVEAPRKYWLYKKSHFKDEIQFKLRDCTQ